MNRIKQDDLLLFIPFILCILSKERLDLRPDYFGIVSKTDNGTDQKLQHSLSIFTQPLSIVDDPPWIS